MWVIFNVFKSFNYINLLFSLILLTSEITFHEKWVNRRYITFNSSCFALAIANFVRYRTSLQVTKGDNSCKKCVITESNWQMDYYAPQMRNTTINRIWKWYCTWCYFNNWLSLTNCTFLKSRRKRCQTSLWSKLVLVHIIYEKRFFITYKSHINLPSWKLCFPEHAL